MNNGTVSPGAYPTPPAILTSHEMASGRAHITNPSSGVISWILSHKIGLVRVLSISRPWSQGASMCDRFYQQSTRLVLVYVASGGKCKESRGGGSVVASSTLFLRWFSYCVKKNHLLHIEG